MLRSAASRAAPARRLSWRERSVALGLVTGALGLVLSVLPPGVDLEESLGLRLLFRWRGGREPPPDVVVVSVDQPSAALLDLPGDPSRWPRSLHADLVENLLRAGAAVVAFDILFDQPRAAGEDRRLADAIRRAGNVVLAEYIVRGTAPPEASAAGPPPVALNVERIVPPLPDLAAAAVASAPFPLPKVPVQVSQYWTFKTSAGGTPTLPVVAFQLYALDAFPAFVALLEAAGVPGVAGLPRDRRVLLEPGRLEAAMGVVRNALERTPAASARIRDGLAARPPGDDARRARLLAALVHLYLGPDSLYLDLYGPARTIPTIPYHRVLAPPGPDDAGRLRLDGKAVFVGTSEFLRPEQKDAFYTVFSREDGADLSGVEIAATAFANLLEARPLRPIGDGARAGLVVSMGLALGILCAVLSPWPAAAAALGVASVYTAGATWTFETSALWCPVVVPALVQAPFAFVTGALWRYAETNRDRLRVRRAFSYYLPEPVIDQLTRASGGPRPGQEPVYGLCMSTDAERYTSLAERLAPVELARFVNEYYAAVFEPIRRHAGRVSDVVGDSVLAIWEGGPEAGLRLRACLAACDIARAVDRFNGSSPWAGLPTRIGLHAGPVVLGHVGAADHYEYRAVGDTVNTADRIQRLNKRLGTQVLASAEVVETLDGFCTRPLGAFLLAGKSQPVVVHELIGPRAGVPASRIEAVERFAEALGACRAGAFDRAERLFAALVEAYGHDPAVALYLDVCRRHRVETPGAEWDGVVRMDEK